MVDTLLANDLISARLDPGRGADILELIHKATGIDILFSTPWRERADQIRAGVARPAGTDSTSTWMEQYRGGWQIICPNPGAPRAIGGAVIGFHGETSTVPWRVLTSSPARATLQADLFSIPLTVFRTVDLDGAKVTVRDVVRNVSEQLVELDYCSHPAFGGILLEGDLILTTGARRFHPDPETYGERAPVWSAWPAADLGTGDPVDLSSIRHLDRPSLIFGWLSNFEDYWVELTNTGVGLSVRVSWDGRTLPYAWLWEELNSTPDFPWFGRARTIAIEPCSTPTSGPARVPGIILGGDEVLEFSTSIEIRHVGGYK